MPALATTKCLTKVAEFKTASPVNYEVLSSDIEIADKKYKLQKAFVYGKRFNIKTEILIVTKDNVLKIISVIYSINDKHITIKGGVVVPIKSILTVEYIY